MFSSACDALLARWARCDVLSLAKLVCSFMMASQAPSARESALLVRPSDGPAGLGSTSHCVLLGMRRALGPLGSPRRSVACQAGALLQDGVSSYFGSRVGPARPTIRRASRPRLAELLCSPRRATRSRPVGLAATYCRLPSWLGPPRWRLKLLRLASRPCSSDLQPGQLASAR